MNRAQNSFEDGQIANIQSAHEELRCYFADHKTMQTRPATTYDLPAEGGYFLLNFAQLSKVTGFDLGHQFGFYTNLPVLIRSFAETGEDLHLHFDSARRVAEAAVESAIARFQGTGSARRWDGTFFTTWSTSLTGNGGPQKS